MPPKKSVKVSKTSEKPKMPTKSSPKVPEKPKVSKLERLGTKVSKASEKPTTPSLKVSEKSEIIQLEEETFETVSVPKKTSPYMSSYEYAALIRTRAVQLGAPDARPFYLDSFKEPEDYDPIRIATREVRENLTSLIIRRTLTDGTTEDWYPRDMIFPRM